MRNAPARCRARTQAALRRSGHRRPADADDLGVHPAPAAGFATGKYRSTDATIYSVVEGEGRSQIGNQAEFISQNELRALSDGYKKLAGFEHERMAAS